MLYLAVFIGVLWSLDLGEDADDAFGARLLPCELSSRLVP
jgi:hypothetical protein